jgi:hypothetical protein
VQEDLPAISHTKIRLSRQLERNLAKLFGFELGAPSPVLKSEECSFVEVTSLVVEK